MKMFISIYFLLVYLTSVLAYSDISGVIHSWNVTSSPVVNYERRLQGEPPSATSNPFCAFIAATNIEFNYSEWHCNINGVPSLSSTPGAPDQIGNVCTWTGVACAGVNVVSISIDAPITGIVIDGVLSRICCMYYCM